MEKFAFISDFDGTISDDDFFAYTTREFFDDEALKPWREYLDGKITHFTALKTMYGALRVEQEKIDHLVRSIKIDRYIRSVFSLCREKSIPIYIVSAGCDYYINYLIGDLIKEFGIKLLTNRSQYSQDRGLEIFAPEKDDPFYDEKTGISKLKLAQNLKSNGYKLIFAGDGPPDVEPAKVADVVFARKVLRDELEKLGVGYRDFADFRAIESYIRNEL
ncbi:phosphoserine phosphatase [Campylobacterota bacterium]|nr:phosphoserine phosphatase [Campylobacterota bacterium]